MRVLAALVALAMAGSSVAADTVPANQTEEVPFVTTPDNVTLAMLQLARVGPQDYVIDLGSGDGRIVITAAKRFGARGLGVELSPDLVEQSRRTARAAGVGERAFFREQDLFKTDLTPASVITMYLLPEVNLMLRPRLQGLRPGTRIVSHDWDLGEWKPDRSLVVDAPDKKVGLQKTSRVHLWVVPARIDGFWCGIGKARGTKLTLQQSFQHVRGELSDADDRRTFEGTIDGYIVKYPAGFTMTYDGARLKVTYAGGKFSPLKNVTFARPRKGDCR